MLAPAELEIARTAPPPGCTPEQARQYTRWLATHHYENFSVVSWLLPRRLQQHFYNVYAYCRWADDLGDEVPDAARALELLDWRERSEEHTSELQSPCNLVCRLLLEKKYRPRTKNGCARLAPS